MLDTMAPLVKVTDFKYIPTGATSSSSKVAKPGCVTICLKLLSEEDLEESNSCPQTKLLPRILRHHMRDVKITHRERHGKHLFDVLLTSKGSIKAMCLAIIRACENREKGYAGLLATVDIGHRAMALTKNTAIFTPDFPGKYTPSMKHTFSDGSLIGTFFSDSFPGLVDYGDDGRWVCFGNIGKQRRASEVIKALVDLDRLFNPFIPEGRVVFDEEGRQGYASHFNPNLISLKTHILALNPEEAGLFLENHAGDLGQLVALQLFSGNIDVHLENIFWDRVTDKLLIFDKDRGYFKVLGKYHGYPLISREAYFSLLSQRDLRQPHKPVDFKTQIWFSINVKSKSAAYLPPSTFNGLFLPGLDVIMKEDEAFKRAYYATLYCISHLNKMHFAELFNAVSNNKLREMMASDFSMRAEDLSYQLWCDPVFYQCYSANKEYFQRQLASLPLNGISCTPLSDSGVEEMIRVALYSKIAEMCEQRVLLKRSEQLVDYTYDENYGKPCSPNWPELNNNARIIRSIKVEIDIIRSILNGEFQQYLTEVQQTQLMDYFNELIERITGIEVVTDLIDKLSENNPVKRLEDCLKSISLQEDLGLAATKKYDKALAKISKELIVFASEMKKYKNHFEFLELMQDRVLLDFNLRIQTVVDEIIALIDIRQEGLDRFLKIDLQSFNTEEEFSAILLQNQHYQSSSVERDQLKLIAKLHHSKLISKNEYDHYKQLFEQNVSALKAHNDKVWSQQSLLMIRSSEDPELVDTQFRCF